MTSQTAYQNDAATKVGLEAGSGFKRLGDYLVENLVCDAATIDRAISLQKKLRKEGIYKPLGHIIVAGYNLKPADLNQSLRRQGLDMLLAAEFFNSIPTEILSTIAEEAEYQVLPGATVLFRQGDRGDCFYLIISGTARVYQDSEDGKEVTLATLGPCEGIGDMALLTGEPRSASVQTQGPTSLLSVSKSAFDQTISENPELTMAFTKLLAERVSIGNDNLSKASSKERAYQRFVTEHSGAHEPHLIGKSLAVRKLHARIRVVSKNNRPVIILGETGTEKKDVASLIHRAGDGQDTPFFVMNAKSPGTRINSADPEGRELAQAGMLFGSEQGVALPSSQTKRLGLLQVIKKGTVLIENIEYLAKSVQEQLSIFIENGNFRPIGSRQPIHSSGRIIATSSADLEERVRSGVFHKKLYEQLFEQILIVKPLRKRKKDIGPIADSFINKFSDQAGKPVHGLSREAYKCIMSYNWPGNTGELKVVIRRAVHLARNDLLIPENIFIGLRPISGKLTFNLLKLDCVSRLFQSQIFPGAGRVVAGAFLALIILSGLFGSQSAERNVALVLTWGIWEPLILLSTIPFAKIWCAVCPVGGLVTLMNRHLTLGRNVPSWIRANGLYASAIGLGVVIWSEAAFRMLHSPMATAVLVLSISLPAILLGAVYRRRVWCRYLCPLGALVGALSRNAFLELRSSYSICNCDCTTHNCSSGDEKLDGCPVYEGPFSLRTNQDCILCGDCIKACPNESPLLNLRIPGSELWQEIKPKTDRAFAFLVPVLIGTQLFRGFHDAGFFHMVAGLERSPAGLVLSMALLSLGSWLFVRVAGSVLFVEHDKGLSMSLMAYGLLPLATGFELGYHLERLLQHAGWILPVVEGQFGLGLGLPGASAAVWFTVSLKVLLAVIGAFASGTVVKKLMAAKPERSATQPSRFYPWPIAVVMMVYILLFFVP